MEKERNNIDELLLAIDGSMKITLAEAEEILSLGFKPFEEFIEGVKADTDRG